MVRTLLSDIREGIILLKDYFLMYGQFRSYGEAVNCCIKENISLNKIEPIYSILGKIDFYSIKEVVDNNFKAGEWML